MFLCALYCVWLYRFVYYGKRIHITKLRRLSFYLSVTWSLLKNDDMKRQCSEQPVWVVQLHRRLDKRKRPHIELERSCLPIRRVTYPRKQCRSENRCAKRWKLCTLDEPFRSRFAEIWMGHTVKYREKALFSFTFLLLAISSYATAIQSIWL